MGDEHYSNSEHRTRVDERRLAWFDGWAEGVVWTLAKTVLVLHQEGCSETVASSVIRHIISRSTTPEVQGQHDM